MRTDSPVEIHRRRGYSGLAHTGEFPGLPVTLELPAIRDDSEPHRDRGLATGSPNPLYRTAWALIANTGGTTALGFVYWVVVAHFYSRQTVGRGSALVAALMLLTSLTQLNLGSALPRFLPTAGRSSRRLISNSYGVSSLAALPVAVGFVWLMPRLSAQWRFLSGSRILELLFVLAALAWGIFALEDAALTGLRRAEVVPIENFAYGVIKLVAVICVARLLPTEGIFASWVVPLFVIIPIVNVLIFRRYLGPGQGVGDGVQFGEVARFASVDLIATLANQACGTVLPLLILSVLGAEANASFYVAWTISFGLSLVAFNFGMSLMVEAAAAPHKLAELTRGIVARCALVTVLGAVVLAAAARPILHIYGATYAAQAAPLLGLLALAAIPRAVVIITWSVDRVAGKVGRAAVTQAALAVLVLAGSRYLLNYFGINGVGYAWAAANFIIATVRLPTLLKALRYSKGLQQTGVAASGAAASAKPLARPSILGGGSRRRRQSGKHRAARSKRASVATEPDTGTRS